MSSKLFSIIIPCYNSEKYIDDALKSVSIQTFDNYEIICVDDGSTDLTLKKLRLWKSCFGGKLKIICQKHGGVSKARNMALNKSKGKYIVFLDSDDKMESGLLQSLSVVINNSNPDCVIGEFKCIAERGMKKLTCENLDKNKIINKSQADVLEYLHQLRFIMAVWRFVIKTAIYKDNRLFFNENVVHEDEEWLTKILMYCYTFQCVDLPFVTYRRRGNSITTNPTNFNYASKLEIANNLLSFSEQFDGYKKRFILRKAYRLCKEIYYTLMEQVEDVNLT